MPGNVGFLTVIDQPPYGLVGGYLVVNQAGRPLEFHCTVPVQPDKIQTILYGDTLQPFLYGERIAHTLFQRSKSPVFAILTDQSAVLTASDSVSVPIIYVFSSFSNLSSSVPDETSAEDTTSKIREISPELDASLKSFGIDSRHLRTRNLSNGETEKIPAIPGFNTENWREISLGNRLIAVPGTDENSRSLLYAETKEFARTIDLLEPFDRIRHALDEAKNVA